MPRKPGVEQQGIGRKEWDGNRHTGHGAYGRRINKFLRTLLDRRNQPLPVDIDRFENFHNRSDGQLAIVDPANDI
jgi:hypothetical protein